MSEICTAALKIVAFEAMESWFLDSRVNQAGCAVTFAQKSLYAMYHPSTRSRAHGVFRRNVRVDFTLGSWRKQRIGTRRPISAHPYRSTRSLMMVSNVIPCNGSRGWERFMIVSLTVWG